MRFPWGWWGLLLLITITSCVTVPAPTIGGRFQPTGTLVSAELQPIRSSFEWSQWLFWASTPVLATQFHTGSLERAEYDRWRDRRRDQLRSVLPIRVIFRTQLVPGGAEDLQSGLLLLPVGQSHRMETVNWVVWTKGTDLDTRRSPSAQNSGETLFAGLLASLGWAVWMPDYAGFGVSTGLQTYCVPDSQALSARDGLVAAREALSQLIGYRDGGALVVVGYSQGGLAAMATARLVHQEPTKVPGLRLRRVYSLGAPLDLTQVVGPQVRPETRLPRPEYTALLVLGWARAYPELRLEEILKPELARRLEPIFVGQDSAQVRREFQILVGKELALITAQDLFHPHYLEQMVLEPNLLPFFRKKWEARLDNWVLPEAEVILATTLQDEVVQPAVTLRAKEKWRQTQPGVPLDYWELGSSNHRTAGVEALVRSVLDLDQRPPTPSPAEN